MNINMYACTSVGSFTQANTDTLNLAVCTYSTQSNGNEHLSHTCVTHHDQLQHDH